MNQQAQTRRNLEDAIISKALSDDSFRDALLANPKQAVESILSEQFPGAHLPDDLTIQAIPELPGTLTIVFPAEQELSAQELELAAGGRPTVRPILVIDQPTSR